MMGGGRGKLGVFQSYKLLLGSHEVDKVGIFPATYVEFADKSAVAATPPKPSYRRSMALSSVSAIPNKVHSRFNANV